MLECLTFFKLSFQVLTHVLYLKKKHYIHFGLRLGLDFTTIMEVSMVARRQAGVGTVAESSHSEL